MRHLLLPALLFLCISLFAQRAHDVTLWGLQGQVHTVRVEHKLAGSPEFTLETELTFSPEGWVIEEKDYAPGNRLQDHVLVTLDGARRVESDATTFFPPELARRIVTSYEAHGFPSQQVTYSLDGTVRERLTMVYEETQIRELHYDADGNLIKVRTTSTLHDPNSPDRHIEQRLNGKIESITDVHKHGDETEVKRREYKDGQVSSNTVSDITKAGTSIAEVNSDGRSYIWTTRNHQSGESINPDGSRVKSKFNNLGQKIGEDHYNAAGTLTESTNFAYENDDHGNWIRRTTTDSRQPGSASVEVRTITYY